MRFRLPSTKSSLPIGVMFTTAGLVVDLLDSFRFAQKHHLSDPLHALTGFLMGIGFAILIVNAVSGRRTNKAV